MSLLASEGDVSDSIAWAKRWKASRLLGGLIHLALVMEPSGSSLSFSMFHRVVSSSSAIQIGVKGTTMLKDLSLMVSFPPVACANFWRGSFCLIQFAVSLLGSSSRIPPLVSILSALIVASGLSGVWMSATAFWKVVSTSSRERHCFLMGWSSSRSRRICLSLMAALALK